jgi:long-chain acyl-CoA synthetase
MVVNVGACSGFYQGDTLKLLDDVGVLKPSIFISVPRLFNRIYDRVNASVNAKGGVAAYLFRTAYESKKRGLKAGTNKHWLWDRLVFGAVRARLGGNVKIMITGAAPISADVIDFLRICFSGISICFI